MAEHGARPVEQVDGHAHRVRGADLRRRRPDVDGHGRHVRRDDRPSRSSVGAGSPSVKPEAVSANESGSANTGCGCVAEHQAAVPAVAGRDHAVGEAHRVDLGDGLLRAPPRRAPRCRPSEAWRPAGRRRPATGAAPVAAGAACSRPHHGATTASTATTATTTAAPIPTRTHRRLLGAGGGRTSVVVSVRRVVIRRVPLRRSSRRPPCASPLRRCRSCSSAVTGVPGGHQPVLVRRPRVRRR